MDDDYIATKAKIDAVPYTDLEVLQGLADLQVDLIWSFGPFPQAPECHTLLSLSLPSGLTSTIGFTDEETDKLRMIRYVFACIKEGAEIEANNEELAQAMRERVGATLN